METQHLESKFARMGARLKFAERRFDLSPANTRISIDIQTDRRGEFFSIETGAKSAAEIGVLDVQAPDRHLLLLVRDDGEKSKFLCGHDERHWFVAGIPEAAPVGTVKQAKEALKPDAVRLAQAVLGLGDKARNRRKNEAFIRQGEWFFIPAVGMAVEEKLVIRDEPLSRGAGSKSHRMEFCYRTGGETVYVCSRHPSGISPGEYGAIISGNPKAKSWGWRTMKLNAGVYAKGRIRHADHATILLQGWHQVAMNTENQSKAMRHVAFLD